jgi:hypothetical protein
MVKAPVSWEYDITPYKFFVGYNPLAIEYSFGKSPVYFNDKNNHILLSKMAMFQLCLINQRVSNVVKPKIDHNPNSVGI